MWFPRATEEATIPGMAVSLLVCSCLGHKSTGMGSMAINTEDICIQHALPILSVSSSSIMI